MAPPCTSSCLPPWFSRSPIQSLACRVTARPAAPSRRPSRPVRRSPSRYSSSRAPRSRSTPATAPTWAESTEVSARSKARKRALDILFEADQRGLNADTLLAQRISKPATQHPLNDYTVEIVQGVVSKWVEINELLATYSQGWTIDRMPAVDRAILRMGGRLQRAGPRRRCHLRGCGVGDHVVDRRLAHLRQRAPGQARRGQADPGLKPACLTTCA